jgi:hypothetical protein
MSAVWNPNCKYDSSNAVCGEGRRCPRSASSLASLVTTVRMGFNTDLKFTFDAYVGITHTHTNTHTHTHPGHRAAGRVKSIKKSNDTLGNQTRYFPICNALPHPTTPLRVVRAYIGVFLQSERWMCQYSSAYVVAANLLRWKSRKVFECRAESCHANWRVFVDGILLYPSSKKWNMDSMQTAGPRHGARSPQELPG